MQRYEKKPLFRIFELLKVLYLRLEIVKNTLIV